MKDPRYNDPRTRRIAYRDNAWNWIVGICAAVLIVGGLWYAMARQTNTMSNTPAATTGQARPAPTSPPPSMPVTNR
jgi:hypothetical protein